MLLLRALRRREGRDPAALFVLVALLAAVAGVLALPRAARLHHVLGIYPFPQLACAAAATALWRATGRGRTARRVGTAAALLAVLGGSLATGLRTLAEIERSGGRGRWSGALAELAAELGDEPDAAVVSLDWGLHAPLRFLDRGLELREPVWRLWLSPAGFSFEGEPRHRYLVWDDPYPVFGFGAAFLRAARALPDAEVTIRPHRDGSGGPAFSSVRFARPHELVYRDARQRFEVLLR